MMRDSDDDGDYIRCPCTVCKHDRYLAPTTVVSHVHKWGIEKPPLADLDSSDDENDFPLDKDEEEDVTRPQGHESFDTGGPTHHIDDHSKGSLLESSPNQDSENVVVESLENATSMEGTMEDTLLYAGSSQTDFDASLSILELQVQHGWTEASVKDLLKVLDSKFLPEDNHLPTSVYHVKKKVQQYVLDYEIIHAGPKDCILFRGEHKDLHQCPECQSMRYKPKKNSKQFPVKVLRYFPLIPKLLRFFKTQSVAGMMTKWKDFVSIDNKVRYPADSAAFKHADSLLEEGGNDPRHVRFGLAVDGVCPFKKLSSKWTLFPLMLTIYNIPPDLICTDPYLWLSMIIPGKKQVTNINTYLRPLIEELELLWKGVPEYDMSRPDGERSFTLRAILMWCLHDFIGYGFVAGCVVQGKHACPICGPNLDARYSKSLKANFFTGNRRFLPELHPFRIRTHSTKTRSAPKETDATQWVTWAEESDKWTSKDIASSKKRSTKKRKRKIGVQSVRKVGKLAVSIRGPAKVHGIKFKSILF
ncbi:unnamed protein product [Calypogeia fissa]